MKEVVQLLWKTRLGAFVLAVVGIAIGVVQLFNNSTAGAIILGALVLAFAAWSIAGLVLRTRLGDPFEVLEGEDHWELHDAAGHLATHTHTRKLRILQDGVFALRDYARGDGDVTQDYDCSPYTACDTFETDGWYHTVISLRDTKYRNDKIDLTTKRKFVDSFTKASEYVNAVIAHDTKKLRITVVFPPDRPPRNPRLTKSSDRDRRKTLRSAGRPDGRQEVSTTLSRPSRGETYMVSWDW